MSKSTHTPDSATSDQALEPGSNRAVTIPTGPVKIHSNQPRGVSSILYFNNTTDNYIRASGEPSGNFLWVFIPGEIAGTYHIKSFNSAMFIQGVTPKSKIIAAPKNETMQQLWSVSTGLSSDKVCIQCVGVGVDNVMQLTEVGRDKYISLIQKMHSTGSGEQNFKLLAS